MVKRFKKISIEAIILLSLTSIGSVAVAIPLSSCSNNSTSNQAEANNLVNSIIDKMVQTITNSNQQSEKLASDVQDSVYKALEETFKNSEITIKTLNVTSNDDTGTLNITYELSYKGFNVRSTKEISGFKIASSTEPTLPSEPETPSKPNPPSDSIPVNKPVSSDTIISVDSSFKTPSIPSGYTSLNNFVNDQSSLTQDKRVPITYESPTIMKLTTQGDEKDIQVISDYLNNTNNNLYDFKTEQLNFYIQEVFYQGYLFLRENFFDNIVNPTFSVKNSIYDVALGERMNLRVAGTLTKDITIQDWVNKIANYDFVKKDFKQNDEVYIDIEFVYKGPNHRWSVEFDSFANDKTFKLNNQDYITQRVPQLKLRIKNINFGVNDSVENYPTKTFGTDQNDPQLVTTCYTMLWDFRTINKDDFMSVTNAEEVKQAPLLIPQSFNGYEMDAKWSYPWLNIDQVVWKSYDLKMAQIPINNLKNSEAAIQEEIQRQVRHTLERNYSDILGDIYCYSIPTTNGTYTIEAQGIIKDYRNQYHSGGISTDISKKPSYQYKPGDIVKIQLNVDYSLYGGVSAVDGLNFYTQSYDFYKVGQQGEFYRFWDNDLRFPEEEGKVRFTVSPFVNLGRGSFKWEVYNSNHQKTFTVIDVTKSFGVPLMSGAKIFTYNENPSVIENNLGDYSK